MVEDKLKGGTKLMTNDIIKTEKNTQTILGVFAILLLVIYTLVSMGRDEWAKYVFVVVGFALALILVSEAGVKTYFMSKKYRQITFSDMIVFGSMILAGGVLLNSFLMISSIKEQAPSWLLSFATSSSVIIGVLGTLVAIFYMVTPRIKA